MTIDKSLEDGPDLALTLADWRDLTQGDEPVDGAEGGDRPILPGSLPSAVTPTVPHDPEAWRQSAACRPDQRPPGMTAVEWADLFFPQRGASLAAAKAVCADCRVRGDCLTHALAHGEKNGVWGGMSERQRRRLRAQPQHGTGDTRSEVARMARAGLSDYAIGRRLGLGERWVREMRRDMGIRRDTHGAIVEGVA